MTKEQIELEMQDLTNRFWVELKMQNFEAVDLLQKRMKTLEALLRIEEDTEEVKPNPAIPEYEIMNFLKRLKKN